MRCHARSGLKLERLWVYPLEVRELGQWEGGNSWGFEESFCLGFPLVLESAAEGRVASATGSCPWRRLLPKSYHRRSYLAFCKARLCPTLGR